MPLKKTFNRVGVTEGCEAEPGAGEEAVEEAANRPAASSRSRSKLYELILVGAAPANVCPLSDDRYDEPRDRGDQPLSGLLRELRDLIESGPMAHLCTINADGSPQVSVIWIGLDGDDLVSGHMGWYAKLRNIERDPRVVLSFDAPRVPGVFLNPYAVLHAGRRSAERRCVEPAQSLDEGLHVP
jgi:Pyridoxamine 5'-phosphate oxidase